MYFAPTAMIQAQQAQQRLFAEARAEGARERRHHPRRGLSAGLFRTTRTAHRAR